MQEKQPPGDESLVDLIELALQGTASDEQKRELEARLLAGAEDRRTYLHRLNLHSALRRHFAFDAEAEASGPLSLTRDRRRVDGGRRGQRARLVTWRWAAAAAVAAGVLFATAYFQRPSAERPIAKVTGSSGSLQWTGAGGRVLDEIAVGRELPGGTIEGMTPGSWFELAFTDGSTVTLSGDSMLTFSDDGQKKLHLKHGGLSANVKPQPAGNPMLIRTRSAMLEVVGTQFEVEAALAATTLNVRKGTVRIRRLSDDNTVVVHARQRVVAAAGREMSPVPVPESVSTWRSRLDLGPIGALGEWSPGSDETAARLRAIPYTTSSGKTIYTAGLGVSRGDNPPVTLQPGSRCRIRGRIASAHEVYFGVTVRHLNGDFAGKFQTTRPAADFQGGQDFEVILKLQDFLLDPSLNEMKSKLPKIPFHLVVESVWCHSLYEPAGLEIAEVELLPPGKSGTPHPSTTAAAPQPMDIWAAAAQGNVQVVRRCLVAGEDVDATVDAPGIPVSGATPLHLAVLFDQGAIARLLIERRANVNARAKDKHGGTPLHWAAAVGRVEMARLLIEAGADVNAPDNNGYTPLDAIDYDPATRKAAKRKLAELLRAKGGKVRP
ncbi:MAG: ankyrin repeat domain-containing protein [Phycisphaerae bacterium]